MTNQKATADHTAQDKIKEARTALRNVNAHTATIIALEAEKTPKRMPETSSQTRIQDASQQLIAAIRDEMTSGCITHAAAAIRGAQGGLTKLSQDINARNQTALARIGRK